MNLGLRADSCVVQLWTYFKGFSFTQVRSHAQYKSLYLCLAEYLKGASHLVQQTNPSTNAYGDEIELYETIEDEEEVENQEHYNYTYYPT